MNRCSSNFMRTTDFNRMNAFKKSPSIFRRYNLDDSRLSTFQCDSLEQLQLTTTRTNQFCLSIIHPQLVTEVWKLRYRRSTLILLAFKLIEANYMQLPIQTSNNSRILQPLWCPSTCAHLLTNIHPNAKLSRICSQTELLSYLQRRRGLYFLMQFRFRASFLLAEGQSCKQRANKSQSDADQAPTTWQPTAGPVESLQGAHIRSIWRITNYKR